MKRNCIFGVSWYDRGEKLFTVTGVSPFDVLRRLVSLIFSKYQIGNN